MLKLKKMNKTIYNIQKNSKILDLNDHLYRIKLIRIWKSIKKYFKSKEFQISKYNNYTIIKNS